MPLLEQKAFRGFASPSNVAMAALVGFLSVGYFTDWKMLRGRPSKSAMAVTPGMPEQFAGSSKQPLRTVRAEKGRTVRLQFSPRSEIADRRAASHEGRESAEVD